MAEAQLEPQKSVAKPGQLTKAELEGCGSPVEPEKWRTMAELRERRAKAEQKG